MGSLFPGGSAVNESACQCRKPRFDPLFGKIPWRTEWQLPPVFFSFLIYFSFNWRIITLQNFVVFCQTLQYSCLENPMDRGAWWATVHGVTKSWTPLSDLTLCQHLLSLDNSHSDRCEVIPYCGFDLHSPHY